MIMPLVVRPRTRPPATMAMLRRGSAGVVLLELEVIETKTVTVSKNGGAFGAATSTLTQLDGSCYKLAVSAADASDIGPIVFKLAGTSHTQYIYGNVVGYDFGRMGAVTDKYLSWLATREQE